MACSQYHLARLAVIPHTRISLIERDLIEPKPEERARIAQALGGDEEEVWPELKAALVTRETGP